MDKIKKILLFIIGVLLFIPSLILEILFFRMPDENQVTRRKKYEEEQGYRWDFYLRTFFPMFHPTERAKTNIGKYFMHENQEYICTSVNKNKARGFHYNCLQVITKEHIALPVKSHTNFYIKPGKWNSMRFLTPKQRKDIWDICYKYSEYTINWFYDGINIHNKATGENFEFNYLDKINTKEGKIASEISECIFKYVDKKYLK